MINAFAKFVMDLSVKVMVFIGVIVFATEPPLILGVLADYAPPAPGMARSLSPEQVARAVTNAPAGARVSVPAVQPKPWAAGVAWAAGDVCAHGGAPFVCIQPHTSLTGWEPSAVPALWRRVWRDGAPWVQPLDQYDAYRAGDHVTHAGRYWASVVAVNVWEPGVYGWSNMAAQAAAPVITEPAAAEWRQPAGAHDAYAIGDRVTYNGKVYESTANANVWAPGVYGWKEVK